MNIKLLVLPPDKLNCWEDLFYHHTELTTGRIATSVHNNNISSQNRSEWFLVLKIHTHLLGLNLDNDGVGKGMYSSRFSMMNWLVWCASSTFILSSILNCWKIPSPLWQICLGVPGGNGKPTSSVRGHGKHAWNTTVWECWWNTRATTSYGSITVSMWPLSQGLYSLSGKTSYRKISWNLEAARFGFKLFQLLLNWTGTSAALLPRCQSNFRAIRPLQHPIPRLRDFTRFGGKTSYRLVNRGPEDLSTSKWRQLTGHCIQG